MPQPIERTPSARQSTLPVTVADEYDPLYASPAPDAAQPISADQAIDRDAFAADEVATSLTLALADSDANVRADALSALGNAHDNPEGASLAYAALSDTDPAVREEAAYALGGIGGEMSVHALAQALRDPHRDVKKSAIQALERIGGDQAALAVGAVLDDPDPVLRAAAVDALREIKGDTAH